MNTNAVVATPGLTVPRVAFPLAVLPVLLIVGVGVLHVAIGLRFPEIATALADIVGP